MSAPPVAGPWAAHERCAVEELGVEACVVVEVGSGVAAVLVLPAGLDPTPYSLHERLNRAFAARGLAEVEQTHLADPADLDLTRGLRRDDVRRRMEHGELPTSGFTTLRA